MTVMVALHCQLSQAGTQKSSQPHPLADIPCKTRPRAWCPTDAAHPWPSCGHVRPALGREVAPRCCAARTCGGGGGGEPAYFSHSPLCAPRTPAPPERFSQAGRWWAPPAALASPLSAERSTWSSPPGVKQPAAHPVQKTAVKEEGLGGRKGCLGAALEHPSPASLGSLPDLQRKA